MLHARAGPPPKAGGAWFRDALWRNRAVYAEVAVAAVFINILATASSLYTMNVYDRVVPNAAYATLWVLTGGVFIAFLFDFLLKNARAWFLDAAGGRADEEMASRVFGHLLAMRMSARPPSVGVHAANLKELETLRDFVTSATLTAIIDLPFTLLFLFLIFLVAGPVVAVPALAIPIVLGAGMMLRRPLDRLARQSMRGAATKSGIIFETLSGIETVKAHGAEDTMQREWDETNAHAAALHLKSRALSALGVNFALFMGNACSVLIVAYGVYLIGDQRLTLGALIAAVILSGRAMAPLASVAGLLTRFSQSREALARLNLLMESPDERPPGHAFVTLPAIRGRIEFRDVVFRYPGQKTPALNGVSFTVEPGAHVGIIGPVGSGKTTIGRLLLNLYQPDSGSVLLDGIDVRQIDPATLRRAIGTVQQSPYMFFGSVRRNITLGRPDAADDAVLRAAEMAGVMNFLRDSEAGLGTQVGERGENLSGGQRQAVAIARALLHDPPVLVLDEPTVSIDPGSERRLYGHLKEAILGKTVLLVTHKGAVLDLVDRLVLMDHGRVVDAGPRTEIIRKLQEGAFK